MNTSFEKVVTPTNVDTPVTCKVLATLTSSRSDIPSTSRLPLASMLPENVASSATVKASTVVAPSTSNAPVTSRSLLNVEIPVTSIPPERTSNPTLAVAIPTESTLVTSSYVNTPVMSTLPLNVEFPVTVNAPTIFVSSRSVVPSTSKFPLASISPEKLAPASVAA